MRAEIGPAKSSFIAPNPPLGAPPNFSHVPPLPEGVNCAPLDIISACISLMNVGGSRPPPVESLLDGAERMRVYVSGG